MLYDHQEYVVILTDAKGFIKKETHVVSGIKAIAQILTHHLEMDDTDLVDVMTVEEYNDLKGGF